MCVALPVEAQAPRVMRDSTFMSRSAVPPVRFYGNNQPSREELLSTWPTATPDNSTDALQESQNNGSRGRNAVIGAVVGGAAVAGLVYYDCTNKTDCNVIPLAAVLVVGAGMALGALVGLLLTPLK